MKFVLTHKLAHSGMQLLQKSGVDVYVANSPVISDYINQLQDADALIIRIGQCDAKIIDQCPKLKVIGRTGIGVDNVDVAHATRMGIPVVITPGVNSRSVAEHTMALMLACAKNLREADIEIRKGNWEVRDSGKAIELSEKKVGIIGVGAIGRIVAQLCKGFGMECFGYSHSHNRKKIEAAGCNYCENIDELFGICDFVTIHCPLTPTTKNMITMKQFKKMKKTAFVINTSRGEIINENNLAEALNTKIIMGAGVDVFSMEPAKKENPLFTAKNIICTPHSAALTKEAAERMGYKVAEGCIAVCNGYKWSNVVDKTAYR